jgi:hypothetical protein
MVIRDHNRELIPQNRIDCVPLDLLLRTQRIHRLCHS